MILKQLPEKYYVGKDDPQKAFPALEVLPNKATRSITANTSCNRSQHCSHEEKRKDDTPDTADCRRDGKKERKGEKHNCRKDDILYRTADERERNADYCHFLLDVFIDD